MIMNAADAGKAMSSILAEFQPEIWDARDNAVEAGPLQHIDVTERVLSMALANIHAIKDRRESSDALVDGLHDHAGPFQVSVERSIGAFFGVDEIAEITQAALDEKKLQYGIDVPKTYEVELTRTSTRHATVSVVARTRDEARALALDGAGDIDFAAEKDAEYDVSSVMAIDAPPKRKMAP